MNRAERRQRTQNKKRRSVKMVLNTWSDDRDRDFYEQHAIENFNHLKKCRGECCKNPRRSKWSAAKGKTAAELEPIPVVDSDLPPDWMADFADWEAGQFRFENGWTPDLEDWQVAGLPDPSIARARFFNLTAPSTVP